MTASSPTQRRVLAIHIASRGFGFAVLESPSVLVDWGVRTTRRDKARKTLAKISDLFALCLPDVLVVEDCEHNTSRRSLRVAQLLESVRDLATSKGLRRCGVSKDTVSNVFLALKAQTKHQIAIVVAKQLPDLSPWLPKYRKPWMSEDYRMAIFDAAALALTYFSTRKVRKSRGQASLSALAQTDAVT